MQMGAFVRRTRRIAGLLGLLVLMLPALGAGERFSALAARALDSGQNAKLPPHLSLVLGLGAGDESPPVKQIATRVGHEVRSFNVCTTNHRNLVIFVYDEDQRLTVAYLLSVAGTLRKAVSYVSGGPPKTLSLSKARPGFERELQFWSDYEAAQPPAH